MTAVNLPGHLELLLTSGPVLDPYHAGPWRVPHGLIDEIRDRTRELAATPEARSLKVRLHPGFKLDATAVAADLLAMAAFLC